MLNIHTIEKLAKTQGENLASIYLNVNRHNFSSLGIKTKAKDLFKDIELPDEDKKDLEKKIFDFLSRLSMNTKSVAIFASKNFWLPFVFPFEIDDDSLTIDTFFDVETLLLILQENKNIGIFLIDSEKARFLSVYLGDLKDHRHLEDHVIQRQAQGGWSKERFERRREEMIKHHLKNSLNLLLKMYKVYKFDYLFLRSDPELEHKFIEMIPLEIKKKIKGDIKVDIRTPAKDIIKKVLELSKEEVTKEEKSIVKEISDILQNEKNSTRAVAGLISVLREFYDERVSMLLVNEGFQEPGLYCGYCKYISLNEEYCPHDQTPNSRDKDIVKVLVDEAVKKKIPIEILKNDETLKKLGDIAAFLKEY